MSSRGDSHERRSAAVGCIFCGGASRRMGTDKALLRVGGRTLLERAVSVLEGRCAVRLLATGPAARYDELGLTQVVDRRPDTGPLAGLEAALEWMHAAGHGDGWLLALACDMPCARGEAFDELLEAAADRQADVALFEGPDGPEPLLAVYHARVLPAVRRALDRGRRRMVAFHDDVRVVRLRLSAEDAATLRNVNTPDELQRCGTAAEGDS